MKISFYHILILICISFIARSESIDIDSVARYYNKIQMIDAWSRSSNDEYQKNLDFLSNSNNEFYISIIKNIFHTHNNDFEKSYVILHELLDKDHKNKIYNAATFYECGLYYQRLHYDEKATSYFKQCYDYLIENSLDKTNNDRIYNEIFIKTIFFLIENYRKSGENQAAKNLILPYIEKYKSDGNLIKLSYSIRQFTNVLFSEKKYAQAYNYLERLDLKEFEPEPNALIDVASAKAYSNFKMNNFDKAIEYERISLDARLGRGDRNLIINSIANIIGFFVANNQLDSADIYYKQLKNYFPLEYTNSIRNISESLNKYFKLKKDSTLFEYTRQIIKNESEDRMISEKIFSISDYVVNQLEEKKEIKRQNSFFKVSILITILLLIVFFMLGVYFYIFNKKLKYQEKLLKEEIEKNLINTQKIDEELKLKKKLIGILSHDLISPLSSSEKLMSLAHELIDTDKDDVKTILDTCKNSINENIKILKNITNWVTNTIEKNTFNPEENDLLKLVNEVVKNFKTQIDHHDINLIIDIPENTKAVFDRDMITTVLRNLIQNAIKFSGKNSIISIYTRQSGKNVNVYIKDNGIGIPNKIKENINNLNKLSNSDISSSSHGFGLKITNDFLQTNGGKLFINEVDEGSEIYFSLPRNA